MHCIVCVFTMEIQTRIYVYNSNGYCWYNYIRINDSFYFLVYVCVLLKTNSLIDEMRFVNILWVVRCIIFTIKLTAVNNIMMFNIVTTVIHFSCLYIDYFVNIYTLYITNIITKSKYINMQSIFASFIKTFDELLQTFIKFKKISVNGFVSLGNGCRSYYKFIYL